VADRPSNDPVPIQPEVGSSAGSALEVFLIVAAILVVQFLRTGGPAMLRMMGGTTDQTGHQHHRTEVAEHGAS
jgi:hypothetical protein